MNKELVINAIEKSFSGEENTTEERAALEAHFRLLCPDAIFVEAENGDWLKANLISAVQNCFQIRFGQ